jgi:hypothetical protein
MVIVIDLFFPQPKLKSAAYPAAKSDQVNNHNRSHRVNGRQIHRSRQPNTKVGKCIRPARQFHNAPRPKPTHLQGIDESGAVLEAESCRGTTRQRRSIRVKTRENGCDSASVAGRLPAAAAGRAALSSERSRVSFSPPIAGAPVRSASLSIQTSPRRRGGRRERMGEGFAELRDTSLFV